MTNQLLECSFLIPIRRDAILSDGGSHPTELWDVLRTELFERFGGWTAEPGDFHGVYRDPQTQEQVFDVSRKYTVAVPEADLGSLRMMLSGVCALFQQKSIYLSIAGHVEFIEAP